MPGVAPEEDALAGLGAHDLAGLRVREHERPLQHVEELVGGEDRPEAVRVTESPPGGSPKTIAWSSWDET